MGGRAARGPEAGFHSVLSDMCHATLGVSAADALRSHELAACAVDLALGAGAGGAAPAPAPAAGPAPGAGPGCAAGGGADPAAGAAGPGPPCPARACKLCLAALLVPDRPPHVGSNTCGAHYLVCRHARRPTQPYLELVLAVQPRRQQSKKQQTVRPPACMPPRGAMAGGQGRAHGASRRSGRRRRRPARARQPGHQAAGGRRHKRAGRAAARALRARGLGHAGGHAAPLARGIPGLRRPAAARPGCRVSGRRCMIGCVMHVLDLSRCSRHVVTWTLDLLGWSATPPRRLAACIPQGGPNSAAGSICRHVSKQQERHWSLEPGASSPVSSALLSKVYFHSAFWACMCTALTGSAVQIGTSCSTAKNCCIPARSHLPTPASERSTKNATWVTRQSRALLLCA